MQASKVAQALTHNDRPTMDHKAGSAVSNKSSAWTKERIKSGMKKTLIRYRSIRLCGVVDVIHSMVAIQKQGLPQSERLVAELQALPIEASMISPIDHS
jgi:hypothetical protein